MKGIRMFRIKIVLRLHSILNNIFTYAIQGSKSRRSLGSQEGILFSDVKSEAVGDRLDIPMRYALNELNKFNSKTVPVTSREGP
jgi:hypothetical protein